MDKDSCALLHFSLLKGASSSFSLNGTYKRYADGSMVKLPAHGDDGSTPRGEEKVSHIMNFSKRKTINATTTSSITPQLCYRTRLKAGTEAWMRIEGRTVARQVDPSRT